MSEDEHSLDIVIDVTDPHAMLGAARELASDGDYEDAAMVADRALANVGEGQALLAGSLHSALATARLALGDVDGAAAAAARAVSVLEGAGEEAASELGHALHTTAMCHLHRGDIDAATSLLDRAAHTLGSAGPEARIDFFSVLLTLAEVAAATGATDEALALCTRVLDEVSSLEPSSEDHAAALNRITGRALFGLGSAFGRRGEVDEAKDYLARAIELFDAGYGHGHPEMTAALMDIAAIYRALGDEDAALAVEEELAAERGDDLDGDAADEDEASDQGSADHDDDASVGDRE